MTRTTLVHRTPCWLALAAGVFACAAPAPEGPKAQIRYAGSATIANFIRDAEPAYGRATFSIDTEPESHGAPEALAGGVADLAGVAHRPAEDQLGPGVESVLIGRDAIAVIVHGDNPVTELKRDQLVAIFTGKTSNWSELGGPDLAIHAYVTGIETASRKVFRSAVLGDAAYEGCEDVHPDADLPARVAADPGGIGHISFSYLGAGAEGVRAVAVDGQEPAVTNFAYPVARPLYLLRMKSDPVAEEFLRWTQSAEGQRVVMQRFVGVDVVGSAEAVSDPQRVGTLTVYTETMPVFDGGIYYYPHREYSILTRTGEVVRRVQNHRGQNDEKPMRVRLPEGVYLIRTERHGKTVEFFAHIESGKSTELNVDHRGGGDQ